MNNVKAQHLHWKSYVMLW